MPDRLWPSPVLTPITEVLEWSTDVLVTEAAEQRIALRTGPRSTLTVSHLLEAAGLAEAAELGRAGPLDDWILPLWYLARPATALINPANLTVFVDTTDGAFDGAAQANIAGNGGRAHLVTERQSWERERDDPNSSRRRRRESPEFRCRRECRRFRRNRLPRWRVRSRVRGTRRRWPG